MIRKTQLNDAVKTIIMLKAEKMKSGLQAGTEYNKYIKDILKQHNTTEPVELFVIGAVDAMIYDVGQSLGFIKDSEKVDDWPSHEIRQEILNDIFPEKIK